MKPIEIFITLILAVTVGLTVLNSFAVLDLYQYHSQDTVIISEAPKIIPCTPYWESIYFARFPEIIASFDKCTGQVTESTLTGMQQAMQQRRDFLNNQIEKERKKLTM